MLIKAKNTTKNAIKNVLLRTWPDAPKNWDTNSRPWFNPEFLGRTARIERPDRRRGMKRTLSVLMALAFLVTGYAQNTATKPADVQSFKAGGTPIVIPSPATNMVEVGYDIREMMEAFVP